MGEEGNHMKVVKKSGTISSGSSGTGWQGEEKTESPCNMRGERMGV